MLQKIMNTLFLSCWEATELIEKGRIIKLSPFELVRKKIHSSMCKACHAFEHQSHVIETMLKRKSIDIQQTGNAKKLLIEKLKNLK